MIRVCGIDDVPPDEGRAVTVGGRRVAVFRAAERWFALDALCPHRGGPLADGIVARRTVTCPLHERRFDLASGREVSGELCVAAHRVEVRGDSVYIVLREEGAGQSIYEQIGGTAVVEAAVDGFYERVWSDPDLIPYFAGIDRERLKSHQCAFIAAALGGPDAHPGRSMAEARAGRGITDRAFDRVVEHLADALAELGVDDATITTIATVLAPASSASSTSSEISGAGSPSPGPPGNPGKTSRRSAVSDRRARPAGSPRSSLEHESRSRWLDADPGTTGPLGHAYTVPPTLPT